MILSTTPERRQDNAVSRLGFVLQVMEVAESGKNVVVKGLCLPEDASCGHPESKVEINQSINISFMTSREAGERLLGLLRFGGGDTLFNQIPAREVVLAISCVREEPLPGGGQVAGTARDPFCSPTLPQPDVSILSEREREMLLQLSKGYANKAIAAKMHVSLSTVRTHLRHIYRKLDVESRTEAVVLFARAQPQMFLNGSEVGQAGGCSAVKSDNAFRQAIQ